MAAKLAERRQRRARMNLEERETAALTGKHVEDAGEHEEEEHEEGHNEKKHKDKKHKKHKDKKHKDKKHHK